MNPTDAKSSAFLLSLRGEKMKLPLTPPLPGLNMCLGILASCMLTKNPGRDSSDPPLLPPSWHEIKTIILGSIHWRLEPSQGFPCGSDGKESARSVGDQGLIPELGRSCGGGYSYPLQYSCLENPMNRGAWWATVHGVAKSQTWLKWFSTHAQKHLTH